MIQFDTIRGPYKRSDGRWSVQLVRNKKLVRTVYFTVEVDATVFATRMREKVKTSPVAETDATYYEVPRSGKPASKQIKKQTVKQILKEAEGFKIDDWIHLLWEKSRACKSKEEGEALRAIASAASQARQFLVVAGIDDSVTAKDDLLEMSADDLKKAMSAINGGKD